MQFEWDEGKNQSNITKHGFDFADAFRIFNLTMVVEFDDRVRIMVKIDMLVLVYWTGEL